MERIGTMSEATFTLPWLPYANAQVYQVGTGDESDLRLWNATQGDGGVYVAETQFVPNGHWIMSIPGVGATIATPDAFEEMFGGSNG